MLLHISRCVKKVLVGIVRSRQQGFFRSAFRALILNGPSVKTPPDHQQQLHRVQTPVRLHKTGELNIVPWNRIQERTGYRPPLRCRRCCPRKAFIMHHEGVDVSMMGTDRQLTRFSTPAMGTYIRNDRNGVRNTSPVRPGGGEYRPYTPDPPITISPGLASAFA